MNISNFGIPLKNGVKGKRITLLLTILLSVVFGCCYMLTPYLAKGSEEPLRWHLLPLGTLLFLGIFAVLVLVVSLFKKGTTRLTLSDSHYRIFYIACFVCNILTGILFLLVYYPGTGNYDTIAIMRNGFGIAKQHPTLYIAFVLVLKKIVFLLGGGYEAVYVANSLITIVLMSFAYTQMIRFLKRKHTPFLVLLAIALFYTLCPIFNLYKVTFLKDVPFSVLLLLWVPILFDTWETAGENLKNIGTSVQVCLYLALSLMRGNGIYVSMFVLVCMLVAARRLWKRLLVYAMVLAVVFFMISGFEQILGVRHLFKETVGVPLQQIAAVVYYDGEITQEQAEFVDQVLPLDFIREKYNPYTSVPLKWGGSPLDDDFLYEHKAEFLQVWAQMLIPNFKTYVKSYLQASYGFWSLGPALGSYRYTSLYEAAYDEWITKHQIDIKTLLPADMQSVLEGIGNQLIRVPGEGVCFWAMMMLVLVLMYFEGWKVFLISAPMLAGVLTVFISTPIAYSWRYILFIPLFIPVLAGLLLRRQHAGQCLSDHG